MKLLRLMLLPALLLLGACALSGVSNPSGAPILSGGPIAGAVLEEGTNKPIPGAIVVVKWEGSVPAFVQSQTVCIHVESAVTGREGKYEVPGWSKPSTVGPWVLNLRPVVAAYKPGYAWAEKPSQKVENDYLVPFKGGTNERFDYLSRVISATSCYSADESYRNLYRVRRALYEEAKAVAQTVEEKQRAERFREFAEDTLVNHSKPTKTDKRGRLINVNPEDSFKPDELK